RATGASLTASRAPSARAYHGYLRLARDVRDWLIAQGMRPRDLIDVHDFIWETMRPAAQRAMKERARGRGRPAEPVAEASAA
ncbi:MAG: hypothetical protein KC420_13290, partial [Myxococcales bacterium]|nr:hypothetical protein [Myxococcales bacterium]